MNSKYQVKRKIMRSSNLTPELRIKRLENKYVDLRGEYNFFVKATLERLAKLEGKIKK